METHHFPPPPAAAAHFSYHQPQQHQLFLPEMAANNNNKNIKNQEDLISKLPDDLLHRIQSLLNVKAAVQTCVLSKRWQHIWKSMPILKFKYSSFPFAMPEDFDEGDYDENKMEAFINFVHQVLDRRQPLSSVSIFQFSCFYDIDPDHVESFMDFAFRHNVQNLKIHACCRVDDDEDGTVDDDDQYIWLPDSILDSKSLSVLKLKGENNSIVLPKSFGLQSLRVLYLDQFELSNDNFDGALISSCPNLEELRLRFVTLNDLRVCNIRAPQLTHLEISHYPDTSPDDRCKFELVVHAPKLISFKFGGLFPLMRSMGDLSSLEETMISLNDMLLPRECRTDEYKRDVAAPRLMKMFHELRNAKSLTLSLGIFEVISKASLALHKDRPSPFYNLKDINLKVHERKLRGVRVPDCALAYFLKSSPKARTTLFDLDEHPEA